MTVKDLQAALAPLQARLRDQKVASLFVFGSVARGEASPRSDVDLLVEFTAPVGLFHFLRVRTLLEEALGCPVDLVTPDALKPALRGAVLNEAVRAA